MARQIAGWALILWGIHKLTYPVFKSYPQILPVGFLISISLFLILAASLLMLYIEEIKEALMSSEAKYRSLVCNIPDSVWTADSGGSIVYSSDGDGGEHSVTEPDNKFEGIHPDDQHCFKTSWRVFFETGKPFNVEYRTKNSGVNWV